MGADSPSNVYAEGNVLRRRQPPHTSPFDRRRSERHTQSASAWLSNAGGAALTSGRMITVCDLSLHGVGFTTDRRCEVGDRHWILIAQGHLRLSTRIRIVSVKKRYGEESWDVGAEFF